MTDRLEALFQEVGPEEFGRLMGLAVADSRKRLRELAVPAVVPWPQVWKRMKCKPEVRARIERLNPNGVEEGCYPRGYSPKRREFNRDVVGPKEFIEQNGVEAYRAAKHMFVHEGHRKVISVQAMRQAGYH